MLSEKCAKCLSTVLLRQKDALKCLYHVDIVDTKAGYIVVMTTSLFEIRWSEVEHIHACADVYNARMIITTSADRYIQFVME